MTGRLLKRPIERIAYRRDEAAAALGVSASTFDEWVRSGKMPKPVSVGGCVLWDVRAVQASWDAIAVDSANPWD